MNFKRIGILLAFVIFAVVSNAPAFAEGETVIKIEAESFITGPDIFDVQSVPEAGNGKYLSSWYAPKDADELIYKYTFTAPEKGNYRLDGMFNELSQSFTTDVSFYVNTPDNVVSNFTKGERLGSYYMYKMSGENVKVNKGKNELYMVLDKEDLNSSGVVVVYLDYFTLTKGAAGAFSLLSVKLNNSAGVYEKNDSVLINFEYSTAAPEAQKYNISITDLWDRPVQNNVITANKGIDYYSINLGKFPVGWYRVRILNEQNNVEVNDYMAFSVVVPYDERAKLEDSSIAADSDMAWNSRIALLDNYKEAFHDLAKLSGIKWLRTRTSGKYSSKIVKEFGYLMKDRNLNQLALTSPDVMGDKTMTGDLLEYGYKLWKEHAEWYDDTLGVLEVVNEADLGNKGNKGAAERYAAYYKAAAIGISDAENHPYQTMTPTATAKGNWVDLLYANDVLKYTDIQNYHAHDNVSVRTRDIKNKAVAYSDEHIPIWLTEAGYTQTAADGSVLSLPQMKEASEQLIKRALDSLSNGNNKHFWFLLTPYIENGGNFSSQHQSGMPYPMYSVLANLTNQLGEANYKGVADLTDGFRGHMFDDGQGNDVLVCFADNEGYINVKADKIKYADMVGYEEIKYADESGKIRIFAGTEPIFVKFFGRSSQDNYYPKTFTSELKKKTFKPNERIVIQQLWSDDITSTDAAHSNGYQLKPGEEYEVSVKVYNLNDEEMSGRINSSAGGQLIWNEGPKEFVISPWSSQIFTYKFSVNENAVGGTDGMVRFWGETYDGKEISSSVAYYMISSEGRVIAADKRVNFENGVSTERWNLANIAEGGKVTMTNNAEEESAIFNVTLPGNPWFFPHFSITDEERNALMNAQGFVFDAKTAGHQGSQSLMMFVYMKDGREFYCPSVKVPFERLEEDFTCCIFPYTQFTLWSSPLGAVEIRPFDVESISHISIGFSGSSEVVIPEYRIRNFGYFYSDLDSEQLTAQEDIEIAGVEANKTYKRGELSDIKAKLNIDDEIASYKVVINNDTISESDFQDGIISFNVGDLQRGAYTIYVTALNNQNGFYCGTKTFFVE